MTSTNRRAFIGGLAVAAGTLVTARAQAAGADGHAAGYDVAPSTDHMPLIPRRTGDPVTFTASLDKSAIKATSGGWARDITTKGLPIATDIAGAHLYLNPGGVREMHWHNSAEWAYILAGHCQVTVVDPEGETEVANYGPGDLWYFPKGHAHAIQTIGSEPCHAVLAFDDGLYGEHGTFGLSDWMSRLEPGLLSQTLGLPNEVASKIPTAEVYIKQGEVIARDSPKARALQVLDPKRTHRFRLMAQNPRVASSGGTIHVASAREYPDIDDVHSCDHETEARLRARPPLAPERERMALRRQGSDTRDAFCVGQAIGHSRAFGRRLRLYPTRMWTLGAEHRYGRL